MCAPKHIWGDRHPKAAERRTRHPGDKVLWHFVNYKVGFADKTIATNKFYSVKIFVQCCCCCWNRYLKLHLVISILLPRKQSLCALSDKVRYLIFKIYFGVFSAFADIGYRPIQKRSELHGVQSSMKHWSTFVPGTPMLSGRSSPAIQTPEKVPTPALSGMLTKRNGAASLESFKINMKQGFSH